MAGTAASVSADESSAYWLGASIFLFHWVVATIAGAAWGALFALALPEQAETLLGAGLYAIVGTLAWPCVAFFIVTQLRANSGSATPTAVDAPKKSSVASSTQSDTSGGWLARASTGGTAGLLIAACSEAESVSHADFLKVLTEELGLADADDALELLAGAGLTMVATLFVVCVLVLADPLTRRFSKHSAGGFFFRVLQTSFWTFTGYIWNNLWYEIAYFLATGPPSAAQNFLRAAVTLLVSLPLARWVLPLQARPSWGIWRTKTLITLRMAVCVNCAYSVADAVWGFCTHDIEDATSTAGGVLSAFALATLLTIATMCIVRCVDGGWSPTATYSRWLLLTASWTCSICYWYPVENLLENIEGFGVEQEGTSADCDGDDDASLTGAGDGSGVAGSGRYPGSHHAGHSGPAWGAGSGSSRWRARKSRGPGMGPPAGGGFEPPSIINCEGGGMPPWLAASLRCLFALLIGAVLAIMLSQAFKRLVRLLRERVLRKHNADLSQRLLEGGGHESDDEDVEHALMKDSLGRMMAYSAGHGPTMLNAPLFTDRTRDSMAEQAQLWDYGGFDADVSNPTLQPRAPSIQ